MVVGDSFWWVADAIIAEHRMASRYDFFYYFNDPDRSAERAVDGQPRGLPPGMSWEYVFSADAIIVEANEGAIGDAGYGFVEAAGRCWAWQLPRGRKQGKVIQVVRTTRERA